MKSLNRVLTFTPLTLALPKDGPRFRDLGSCCCLPLLHGFANNFLVNVNGILAETCKVSAIERGFCAAQTDSDGVETERCSATAVSRPQLGTLI